MDGELEHPLPHGGSSNNNNKPNLNITYTLTIISKFCAGEVLTGNTVYTKGSQALCTAVSLYNDSCIFHCWLHNGGVFSTSAHISLIMDNDYTYTAKYQSITNKECYDLAKLSADAVLKSKIDSLRNRTRYTDEEQGVAQRRDGSYYKMQTGTGSSILMPQEPGIKYSRIFHTHPSGYCCVSGGDLVGLISLINQRRNDILDNFYFGVVAGNDILALKVKDITALRKYFTQYNGMNSEEAAKKYRKKI